MWSKQRPTEDGYYWCKRKSFPFPAYVFEREEDGKMIVLLIGDTTHYELESPEFDNTLWKPLGIWFLNRITE